MYRAIKLICNRVTHESEIVCRYLNFTLQKAQLETQVRCINRKRHTDSNPWMTRLQINLIARYMYERWYLEIYSW
jgi:hypothetical protein